MNQSPWNGSARAEREYCKRIAKQRRQSRKGKAAYMSIEDYVPPKPRARAR